MGIRSNNSRIGVAMRVVIGALIVAVGATITGCATTAVSQSARSAGDVVFAVPVAAADGAEVEVSISGNDMQSPVLAELAVEDGVARGTIDEIEAGADRLVVITAYQAWGQQCSNAQSVDIAAGQTTVVDDLTLDCQLPDATVAGLVPKN